MKILKRLVFLFLAVIIFIPANTFPLKITAVDLDKFDSLLVNLSSHNVKELNLSFTNINDDELEKILNKIGKNLRTLILCGCKKLNNFEVIKNCAKLQVLYLDSADITDEQLKNILNQISGNLRALCLWNCNNLHNVEVIRNWTQERNINLVL